MGWTGKGTGKRLGWHAGSAYTLNRALSSLGCEFCLSAWQKGILGPLACHCDFSEFYKRIVTFFLYCLSKIDIQKSSSTIKYLNMQGHLDLHPASILNFLASSEAWGQLDEGKSADLMIWNFH